MPRTRRREVKATYDGSVAFDAVNGLNVAIPVAVVNVTLDRIDLRWDCEETPYPFRGLFKVRGLLAVFDATGAVLFESEAEVYLHGDGYGFLHRIWPDRQRRLVLTAEC